ncbi:MAG TPA: hypothetical protein PKC40_06470 [Saprospiraceae bacterium]|nr:hypothetical protein [Saprospiraceae bacterium]
MKSLFTTITLLAFFLPSVLTAQKKIKEAPVFNGYHKNIFVEVLGSSILAGVNFDMRLKRGRMDGIGFRAGIGGQSATGKDSNGTYRVGVVTFPLEFNVLKGKRRSAFYAGAGLLPVYVGISGNVKTDLEPWYFFGEAFGISGGYLTFGYRLQPLRQGFMMQINWNPMILRGSGFNWAWVGLGLGYGFK